MNDALIALAVGLGIRDVPEEQAAALAERHGLVTHLTSLFLVDEAGDMQEGLPALRKVAVPDPAIGVLPMVACSRISRADEKEAFRIADPIELKPRRAFREPTFLDKGPQNTPQPHIFRLAHALDWNVDPAGLVAGDADALVTERPGDQEWFEQMFAALVARHDIEELAHDLGKSALQIAILVLAYVAKDMDRTAARVLRTARLGQNLARLRALGGLG